MKNLYCFCFLLLMTLFTWAQVGINTTEPRGVLDVQNNPGEEFGLVIPTISSAENLTIANGEPIPNGIMFYDVSRDAICYKLATGFQCWGENPITFVVPPNYSAAIQEGYIKASNTNTKDNFGYAVTLSADGNTMVVGAREEDSNSQTINQGESNNQLLSSGAAYVFIRTATGWEQQAYLKASNSGITDRFGQAVSISDDGNTLAIAAYNERSDATGVNQDPNNDNAPASGAVYIFTRTGTTWSQHSYIKASNTNEFDEFGYSISLSGDGLTLAVGATGEQSNATGINQDESNNNLDYAGAAYVYVFDSNTWAQEAYVKASNTSAFDDFGEAVALSYNGDVMAVGATNSGSTGAVYIYERNGSGWSETSTFNGSNSDYGDYFGISVSLSPDGQTLAVGAYSEESDVPGINSTNDNNNLTSAGAVYVFQNENSTWNQQAYIKPTRTHDYQLFGYSIALGTDQGNTLIVGALNENSNATGINGNENNSDELRSGAVYVYNRNGSLWTQQAYVKASNTETYDKFGHAVAVSASGHTMAAGSLQEQSNAVGINGDQNNNDMDKAGAVYVFEAP